MSATPRVWPVTDTSYILRVGHENRCFVFDTVVLNVSKVTAQYTVAPVCLNQSSLFDATATVSTHSPVSTYTWQYGDGTSTGSGITSNHTYSTYNVYSDTLIVINSIGCRDTAYGSSTVYDLPNAKLGLSDSSVCLGTCITLTDLSTPGASAAISQSNFDVQNDGVVDYTTSPSQHCYASSGNYTVRLIVMDNNLCRDTADRKVVVHSIPVASFNNDSNCINVDNVFESNTILGDGPIKRYLWSIGGTGQPEDSSMIVRAFPNAGIYTVCLRTTDVYGCFDDTCKAIQVFASAIDTVTPLDTTICVGYSAAFQVKGSFDRVEWVPSAWVDNPTGANVVITPKQTIRYNVLSYYKQCPPKVDTVNIWVIDSVPVSASADPQNIVLGLSSNVTSTVKGTIDSIVWDPDSTLSCRSCRNPIATPSATTTYTATVYYTKNKVTCSNRTQVTITVFRSCDNSLIYIPNTFTPNNDGNNDVFRIRGQGITKVNYFRVFDRWGKIVYEANNVDDTNDAAWNGCFNNDKTKPVNSDVFVYLFEVECVTGQKINGKGNVTLIR
jgi:gliding motility-associated-like protein